MDEETRRMSSVDVADDHVSIAYESYDVPGTADILAEEYGLERGGYDPESNVQPLHHGSGAEVVVRQDEILIAGEPLHRADTEALQALGEGVRAALDLYEAEDTPPPVPGDGFDDYLPTGDDSLLPDGTIHTGDDTFPTGAGAGWRGF